MFIAYTQGAPAREALSKVLKSIESGVTPDNRDLEFLQKYIAEGYSIGNSSEIAEYSIKEFETMVGDLLVTNPRGMESMFDLGVGRGVVRVDEISGVVKVKRFYWSD